MDGESPRTLGKYRLIAEIARGGMGIVYLALLQGPSGFSKLLVVKELQPELVEETAFLEMFLEEARLAARLNHSNIVQTNEVGNDGARYFMAMDYLDGRGLERIRRRARYVNKPMSLALHVRVLCDVLAGLEYAHNFTDFDGTPLGIVHRDVSPQNVFVTFEGQTKLLDFGIAKTIDSTNETRAGVLKGKLAYMAPEQARGERVDARADVFAVGVMLWEALTGTSLRGKQNEHQILGDLIAKITPPRASTVNPDVPPELDEICARALAPDRVDRYHSASALQVDLEAYLITLGRQVTSRDLGAYVRELFHDDRIKTSAMIEQYVARARAGGETDDDLPIIDVSYAGSDVRTPVAGEPSQRMRSVSSSGVSSSGTSKASISANRPVGTLEHAVQVAPEVPVTPQPTQPYPAMLPKRSWATWVGVPVLMVSSVLVGGLIYSKSHPSRAPVAVPQSEPIAPIEMKPQATPPPVAPDLTGLVDVQVKAVPATAMIEIDGASVSGNPFHGRYVHDGAMHQVRISAPGHYTKTSAVSFDAPVAIAIELERVPVSRPVARPVARPGHVVVAPVETRTAPPEPKPVVEPKPAPPTQKATEVDPNGGSKPRRSIDPQNPYGN